MAENNLSFKTAFKKFYEPPLDSKNVFTIYCENNERPCCDDAPEIIARKARAVTKVNDWLNQCRENNERQCSDDAPEIIAQKARAETKVNECLNLCQSDEGSFGKGSNKANSNVSRGYTSKTNSKQRGEVPDWNKAFKEILENKSDLRKDELNSIKRSFQKDVPIFASKKQGRRNPKKKEINHECVFETVSYNRNKEMSKALQAEAEADFVSWGKFRYEIPSVNDFDGAGVDIYKGDQSIYKTWLNMPQDLKDVIVGKDPRLEVIEKHHNAKKKQMEQASNKISNETVTTKVPEKHIGNSPMQKSNTTVKQIEQVDNSNDLNKHMKHVDNRNFQNKDTPDGSFILKKSNASEMQTEQANNKNGKKKNRKYRKFNEAEMKLSEMFTTRPSYKIHSSGDVYSADDANLEANKKKDIESAYWEHPIIHPIIDQPRPSLPMADTPRLPPPPPVPFDEPAWDDDFYILQN